MVQVSGKYMLNVYPDPRGAVKRVGERLNMATAARVVQGSV